MDHRKQFDPRDLNDPVASRTEWGPCKPGGANFRSHVLEERSPDRVRFRPTVGLVVFTSAFAFGGLLSLKEALDLALGKQPDWVEVVFLLVFAATFGGVGFWQLYRALRPPTFDKQLGLFFFGSPNADALHLRDVHALQIVSEYVGGKSRFYSYELNLVRRDGTRVNVVDHANLAALRADAASLARFLRVPLWDPVQPNS